MKPFMSLSGIGIALHKRLHDIMIRPQNASYSRLLHIVAGLVLKHISCRTVANLLHCKNKSI